MPTEDTTNTKSSETRSGLPSWLWGVFFGGIFACLLAAITPDMIFSLNTPTGGDMGSHYYTAWYTANQLLPHLAFSAWDFGWFAGYGPFVFYFPLTFILIALGSFVIALPVAFKLVALLGVFLLPIAVFALIRSFSLNRAAAAAGSGLSLLLLLNTNMGSSAQIWGGTVMSVLAGEFSQSLSIAVAIFFLAAFQQLLVGRMGVALPGLLLGLTLLAHPLSFVWVVPVALALAGFSIRSRRSFWQAAMVGLIGFGVVVGWAAPMLHNRAYFLNLGSEWAIQFKDVLPRIWLWLPIGLAVASLTWRREYAKFISLLAVGAITGLILWQIGPRIGIYGVRFLPYVQLCFILTGVFFVAWIRKPWMQALASVLVLVLAAWFTQSIVQTTVLPGWVRWNFQGLERKDNFESFRQANEFVKGTVNDPRVIAEYLQANNDTGTPRNNELVPYLSGRQTLEGLYLASSITNPFIFKIQSELSSDRSCQTDSTGLRCGTIDLPLGKEHMRMFNVTQLIIRSQRMRELLALDPSFTRQADFGIFDVWSFSGGDGKYVVVPDHQPVVYAGPESWQQVAYRWFVDPFRLRTPVIFGAKTNELTDTPRIASLEEMTPVAFSESCNVGARLDFNSIRFSTDCPGQPHLIRVSYSPGWRAETGERIYLASPSFMMVYPQGREVELRFGSAWPYRLWWLSGLVILACLVMIGREYLLPRTKSVSKLHGE